MKSLKFANDPMTTLCALILEVTDVHTKNS